MGSLYLGLDLSLTGTGMVTVDGDGGMKLESLIRSKKDGDTPLDELKRIRGIVSDIRELLVYNCTNVVSAAIEGIAFGVNKTTHLAQLSALNYMVRDLLYEQRIPFVIVAPKTLKKYVTGNGNASKEEMMLETLNRHGLSFVNDNLCDAFGLALVAKGVAVGGDLTKDQKSAILNLRKQLPE